MKYLRPSLPILLILLAPLAMMYPLWGNPVSAGEDDIIYYYPLRQMAGQALAAGRLPLENPLEGTGGPLLADPQSALMHPTTWLFAVMDAKTAYTLSIFFAFWAAGLGMYVYLRRLGLIRAAATFGAVAFMFCGFMVGHRVHLSMIQTVAMLPWILWCMEQLRRPAVPCYSSENGSCATPGRGLVGGATPPSTRRLRVARTPDFTGNGALLAFAVFTPVMLLAIAAGNWPSLIQMGMIAVAYFLLRVRPIWRGAAVLGAGVVLAVMVAGPQIAATMDLMSQATRQKIGFSTFGENSFFPAAAVLAVLPMILGNRTPNFFGQSWWGPWHQCEMLGYVGLIALVLAGATVWCVYRRPKATTPEATDAATEEGLSSLRPLVRVWTWIALAAGVWMLGYYLPSYRLIHLIPGLNVVRCPARMVMAVDFALATLAAVGIHLAASQPAGQGLHRAIRKAATFVLPMVMVVVLALMAVFAWWVTWPEFWSFFVGKAPQAREALRIANPAIWVQMILLVATVATVRFWLARPERRAAILVGMLLLDLLFVARFVDMPPAGQAVPDPEVSPAAEWLARSAPDRQSYRVWGIGKTYFDRPAELLLPKTGQSLGFATMGTYGPFQSPARGHLLGWSIFGTHRDWASVLRRNYLLSMYGVRYILAADRGIRDVIESVRIPTTPDSPDGSNLLGEKWELERASLDGGVLRLVTPFMWLPSSARQDVTIQPGGVYRIRLDARGPDSGAACHLRLEVAGLFAGMDSMEWDQTGLSIRPEEISTDWRHFEWTFQAPAEVPEGVFFQISSLGERPVEVRNVSLCQSHFDRPVDPQGRIAPGGSIYELRAELPAVKPGDAPVAIYENRLWQLPIANCQLSIEQQESAHPSNGQLEMGNGKFLNEEQIEHLKWEYPLSATGLLPAAPDVGLHLRAEPWLLLGRCSAVAIMTYVGVVGAGLVMRRRKKVFWTF